MNAMQKQLATVVVMLFMLVSIPNLTWAANDVQVMGQGEVNTSYGGGGVCLPDQPCDFENVVYRVLEPKPYSGWRFFQWQGDECAGEENICAIQLNITFDTVTAVFLKEHTLKVSTDGNGKVNAPDIDCGTNCETTYIGDEGTITLTATPNLNFDLKSWGNSACDDTSLTCTLPKGQDNTVSVTFIEKHELNVKVEGLGNVTGDNINCGTENICHTTYATSDETITLTVHHDNGHVLSSWGNSACDDNATTCVLSKSQNHEVSVKFSAQYMTLVEKIGEGHVNGEGIDCGGVCEKIDTENTGNITLVATPAENHVFGGWGNPNCDDNVTTCTLPKGQNNEVSVTFTLITQYTLTVTKTGEGVVTGENIDCGTQCVATHTETGGELVLTAVPTDGNDLIDWGNPTCDNAFLACTLPKGQNHQLNVTFEKSVSKLNLNVSVAGNGKVISDVIDCDKNGGVCSTHYESNEETYNILSVMPADGYTYTWEGACEGTTENECYVPKHISADVSVTFSLIIPDDCVPASFNPETRILSIYRIFIPMFDPITGKSIGGQIVETSMTLTPGVNDFKYNLNNEHKVIANNVSNSDINPQNLQCVAYYDVRQNKILIPQVKTRRVIISPPPIPKTYGSEIVLENFSMTLLSLYPDEWVYSVTSLGSEFCDAHVASSWKTLLMPDEDNAVNKFPLCKN